MKYLFQSDDYGITRAVSLGCIHGIRNGVIRNTGMFANMPWIEECVEWIRPYLDDIAFGIDLNASTGPSILGHDALPTLTHEDGSFLGSRENRALDTDENDHDHLAAVADQLEAEFRAQIERYIELVGKKPDYIHNHAYARVGRRVRRAVLRGIPGPARGGARGHGLVPVGRPRGAAEGRPSGLPHQRPGRLVGQRQGVGLCGEPLRLCRRRALPADELHPLPPYGLGLHDVA